MSNFIDLKNISKDQLIDLVSLSIKWKKELPSRFMKDKQVVLIFEDVVLNSGLPVFKCQDEEREKHEERLLNLFIFVR